MPGWTRASTPRIDSLPPTMSSTPTAIRVAGAAARAPDAPAVPAKAAPAWPNVHAPDAARARTDEVAQPTNARRALRALLRNPTAMAGLVILALMALLALAAPWLYPEDPLSMVDAPFIRPFTQPGYLLGTDSMGRDVAAGIAHGARVSLLVGISATLVGLGLGIAVGAPAGYFGGWVDEALQRLVILFQAIPNFILLIVIVAIAQPSLPVITLAIGLVTWPTVARLVRTEFRALRHKEFVLAARSLGYGHLRIILREILPNALPPLIVSASVMVATAILMESGLAFMGMGDPNVVSWGSMIGAGREQLRTAAYLTMAPGLAIVFTVLALNLLGDGLNDALNPRLSRER